MLVQPMFILADTVENLLSVHLDKDENRIQLG